ncbi:MAG: hypothetical protein GTN36_04490 [Candidatus Aenigmarchaeota archaeon]|nr:hypothetical protein [Candidatus Aenigmarchaeota archaeon]
MKIKTWIISIISLLFIISLFILINVQEPPKPKEFAKNQTSSNYSTLFFKYEIKRYPSNVEIRPTEDINETTVLGFVTEPWNINFGIIPANGSFVTRNIKIGNSGERNNKIILKVYGNISPLVVFSKNNFILKPNEKASIDIFLYSKGFGPGKYFGEIDVIAQKDIYNFLPIA